MEASGRSSSAALAEIDELLADIIPDHQPRRGFDQTRQTGYLSVDALRGRLAVAMPSPDRLAIAPNSRQMEILTKRVAPPPVIPEISPRTSSRLADLNKTALLVHKDRQEAKLKEGARERKLEEARREAMGKTPDYLKYSARRRDKGAATAMGSSLPPSNRLQRQPQPQPQSQTQVPRTRRPEHEAQAGLQRAPHLVQKPETNPPTPLFRPPANQDTAAAGQQGILLTPVPGGKSTTSEGPFSSSRGQTGGVGPPNASTTIRGADTPLPAEPPATSDTPAPGEYGESLLPGLDGSSSRLAEVATAPPTLFRGESWVRCAARGGSDSSKKVKRFYYYNASTGESKWEPPPGFINDGEYTSGSNAATVSANRHLASDLQSTQQPVRPMTKSGGQQSPRLQSLNYTGKRKPTSATTAESSRDTAATGSISRNMPPQRPASAMDRRRVPINHSSTEDEDVQNGLLTQPTSTLAPLHATPARMFSENAASLQADAAALTPSDAAASVTWNKNSSSTGQGFGTTWVDSSEDTAAADASTNVRQVGPRRPSSENTGAAASGRISKLDATHDHSERPKPLSKKPSVITKKSTSEALITRGEIVGDEARKETAALSEWVANPYHASLLKEPGHLLIVITHDEHPDRPGSGVTAKATTPGAEDGTVPRATSAEGAPLALSTAAATGTPAAPAPTPAFNRFQKSAAEISTALKAVVQDLAGVPKVTVRTQSGLPGELNVCCAIRHSPHVHQKAQVYTRVLFSRELSGGWPSAKRTSRKLTDWLRDEVSASMVPKAAGRAQGFEQLICESVVRQLDEWKLTATWAKVLDVPFEDAVRFEYDGPTPPPMSISEVARRQLDAAKAKAQAQLDQEKKAAAIIIGGGVGDSTSKERRASNEDRDENQDGDQAEVVSDNGSSSDDSDYENNEGSGDKAAGNKTVDNHVTGLKKQGIGGSSGRRSSSGGGGAQSSSGRSSWRRLQSAQARLASGNDSSTDLTAHPTAAGGRALKTKDAAAITVFKWRAAKARSEGMMEGVPAPKAPPPPRPLATSKETLSALMRSATSSSSTSKGSNASSGGGGSGSSKSSKSEVSEDVSAPKAAAAAAAAVAATEELPTRTVHVCTVPGRARLVLFGVRDAPHAYAPTQGFPGTVLEAAAAAPPSVAFAATAPTFTGSNKKNRSDLNSNNSSSASSRIGGNSKNSNSNTGGSSGKGTPTTTVYRGMHWHCLLPAGPGFGHDVGFAETPDLHVKPGRGDTSSWPNLSTSSPSRSSPSKPLLLTDKKASSTGATNKTAKRSTASSSSALVVSKRGQANDEGPTGPTTSDKSGSSNSSNARGDVRLERMSWAGSGGGRCPGNKTSKLAVPTHPWPPGTQIRLHEQIEHMPAGSNAVVQRVVLRPEGSANSAKAPLTSSSPAPSSLLASSAIEDQPDINTEANAAASSSTATAAANTTGGSPSSPSLRTVSLHNPFAYKVKAPGLATGTVMGADCPVKMEPMAPWQDPSIPPNRRKVVYVLMFGAPILPPVEVEQAMQAEAAKTLDDDEGEEVSQGEDDTVEFEGDDEDGIADKDTMLTLTAGPDTVSSILGIVDDISSSENAALLDRPPGMTTEPTPATGDETMNMPPGMDAPPSVDDVAHIVRDFVDSLIETAATKAEEESQAVADAAALEAKRLAVEEAAQAHVAAAAGVAAILDKWEDWVDIQARARAEIAAAAEARARGQQRRAAQAAVAAAEAAAAEAERQAAEAAAHKEMLAKELALTQAREEALKKALTIRSEETQLQAQLDEAQARERTLLFGIRQSEALAKAAEQRRHQSARSLQAAQRGRATRHKTGPQLVAHRAQQLARVHAAVKIQVLARQAQAKRIKQQRMSRREEERAAALRAAEEVRIAAIARAEELAAAAAAAQSAAAITLQCTARKRRAHLKVRARRAAALAAAAAVYAQAARMQRALRFMQSMGSTVEHMWMASAWSTWQWSTAMSRDRAQSRAATTLQAQNRRRSAQREAQARAAQVAAAAAALAAKQQAAATTIQCATRQRQAQQEVAAHRVRVTAVSSLQRATRGQQARATASHLRSHKHATLVLQGACRMLAAKRRAARVRAEKLAMGLARWDKRAAEISARIASSMSAGDDAAMTEALERDSFRVGASVEARRKNQAEWVGATVKRVNGGNDEDAPATSFDLIFGAGDSEQSVPRMRVRLSGQREPYKLSNGTLCEVRLHNNAEEYDDELFPGVVMSSWPDGQHYMVECGNGQRDPKVPRDQIFVQCAYKKSDKTTPMKKKVNSRRKNNPSSSTEQTSSSNRGNSPTAEDDDLSKENPDMVGLSAHRRSLAKLLSDLKGSVESLHWYQGAACKLQAAERGRQGRVKTRQERQARKEADHRASQETAAAVTLQTTARQRSRAIAAGSARSARAQAKKEQIRERAAVFLQCLARRRAAHCSTREKRESQYRMNLAQRAAAMQVQCLVRMIQAKRRVTLRRLENEATLAEHRRHLTEALTTLEQRLDGLQSRVGAAVAIQSGWRQWIAVQQCKRTRRRRAEAQAASEATTSKAHVLARERSMRREAEQERYLQRKADEARRLAEKAAAAEIAALDAHRAAAATQLQSQARRVIALDSAAIKRGEAWILAQNDPKKKKQRAALKLKQINNPTEGHGAATDEDEVLKAAQTVYPGSPLRVGIVVEVRRRHRVQPEAFRLLATALDTTAAAAAAARGLATSNGSGGSVQSDASLSVVEANEAATLVVFGESRVMTPTAYLAPLAVWESGVVVCVRPNGSFDVKCVPSGEVRYHLPRHWLRGFGHRELFHLPVGALVECGGQMGRVVDKASSETVARGVNRTVEATTNAAAAVAGTMHVNRPANLALVNVQLSEASGGSQLVPLPRRWLTSQCEAVPVKHTAAAITLQAWARQLAAFTVVVVARNRAAVRSFFGGRSRVRNLAELGFLVGAIVEARYKGREQWFSAAIASVCPARSDAPSSSSSAPYCFDAVYADGDFEESVPRLHVRLANQIEPFHLLHGDVCLARYVTSKKFYPGVIVNAWPDGQHYMVEFDDGDRSSKIPRDHIIVECAFPLPRHSRAATAIQSLVRGTFARRRAFNLKRAQHFFSAPNSDELIRQWLEELEGSRDQPQTIRSWNSAVSNSGDSSSSSSAHHHRRIDAARVNLDVSFGVEGSSLALGDNDDYDNSVEEEAVDDVDGDDGSNADGAFFNPPTVASVLRCLHGVSVEARYKSRELWFPAILESARENGTLNLFFDDGDCAFGTPRFRVRLPGQVESWRLAPGSFVDARFRSSAKHFPGVVVNAWPDGQHYMVEFDDEDRDPRVPRAHILSQCVYPAPSEVSAVTRIAALCRGVKTRCAVATSKNELEKARQVRLEAQQEAKEEAELLLTAAIEKEEARTRAATALQSLARGRSTRKEIKPRRASARTIAKVVEFFGCNKETSTGVNVVNRTAATAAAADDDLSFLVGTKVEARYRGRYQWFNAVISATATSVNTDSDETSTVTMDLLFADGDAEYRVPRYRVRLPGQTEPPQLEVGALVDGRYDPKSSKLYPGVVVNAWPDGQHFMIEFDDGDKLPKVPRKHLIAQCATISSQPRSKASEHLHIAVQDTTEATGSTMRDNAISPHNSPLYSVPDDEDDINGDDGPEVGRREALMVAAISGDPRLQKRSLPTSRSTVSNQSFSLDRLEPQNRDQSSNAAHLEGPAQIGRKNMAQKQYSEAQHAATTLQAAARGRFAKQSLRKQRGQFASAAADVETLCMKLRNKLSEFRGGSGLARIRAVFESAGANGSSDVLDFFELERAVALLIGQPLPSAVVAEMVNTLSLAPASLPPASSSISDSLTLLQFVHLMHTFDFETATKSALMATVDSSGSNNNTFEVDFHDESLGFKVRSVPGQKLAVSAVLTPSLESTLSINDIISAVNGAPISAVDDPAVFVKKIAPLRRPLRITFRRTSSSTEKGSSMSPAAFNTTRIEEVFARLDVDKSGNLDIFYLAHAVEALIGQFPSTKQVAVMVRATGLSAYKNALTLAQFTYLMRTYDWMGSTPLQPMESSSVPSTELNKQQYEHCFESKELGFHVTRGNISGQVMVASVTSPKLVGLMSSGDAILAVNSAPVGYISDLKTFVQRIKQLRRPLVMTFERPEVTPAFNEAVSYDLSLPRLRSVFQQIDANHSGCLDSFELAHALEASLGFSPSSKQVSGFLRSVASSSHASITLPQFCYMMRAFDWADDYGGFGSLRKNINHASHEDLEQRFELSFPKKGLGFKVQEHESENSVIVVSAITDVALVGVVAPGDVLVTVNGVPLRSEIVDPRQLQAKLGPARRPVRIGFARGGNSTAGIQSSAMSPAVQELSRARIQKVFAQFDVDKSGNLSTFDLAHAVEVLIGRHPSTNQVAASLLRVSHDSNGDQPNFGNMLSLAAFLRIVQDLKSTTSDSTDVGKGDAFKDEILGSVDLGHSRWATPWLAHGLFELHFPKEKLGFNVQVNEDLSVVVVEVADPALQGILSVNDRVIAMNGAPIGAVADPDAFIMKVISIRRPVKFTVERFEIASSGNFAQSNIANDSIFAEDFGDLSVGRLTSVYTRFIADSGGTLDPFELLNALRALHGIRPPSHQIAKLINDLHSDDENVDTVGGTASGVSVPAEKLPSNDSDAQSAPHTSKGSFKDDQLSLLEFVHIALTSASFMNTVIEGGDFEDLSRFGEAMCELNFESESLGFRVRSAAGEGTLEVSRILDPGLTNALGVRDALVAVNGVPLGFVSNPKAVQERIARIRPVRLAFQRYATPRRVEAATSLQAWQRQKLAQAKAQRHGLRITSALQLQRTARYFLARRHARTLRATRDQLLYSRYWEGPGICELPIVDSQAFAVGTEVEARYKGRHEWFRAMIVASHRNNTSFDLRYEDGDSEQLVPRMRVRLPGQREHYKLNNGTLCEARFEGSKKLYSGNVVNAWRDGQHYMVEFHDGDRDARVPRGSIFTQCISASSPQLDAIQRANQYPLHKKYDHGKPNAASSSSGPHSSFYSEHIDEREELGQHIVTSALAPSSPRTPHLSTQRAPLTPPSIAVTASPGPSLNTPVNIPLSPSGSAVPDELEALALGQERQLLSHIGIDVGTANDTSTDEESEIFGDYGGILAGSFESTSKLGMGSRYY